MATSTGNLIDIIYEQARRLPPDSLLELAKYVEYLQYKVSGQEMIQVPVNGDVLSRLDGILEGYDFSPELLATARQELWQGFGDVAS
jgi:hypothetical protein